MTDLREAAQAVLHYLRYGEPEGWTNKDAHEYLSAALAAPEPQDARYETEDCDHGHERELRRIGYGVMAHGSVEDIEALCSILNGKPLAQPEEVPGAE